MTHRMGRRSSPKRSRHRSGPELLPLRVWAGCVTCATCGKVAYPSKATAKRHGRSLYPGQQMRAYKCGQWWHLTSQNTAATEYYRQQRAKPRVSDETA